MRNRIVKTRIADSMFLLRFETQYELASTFLRIQEHHESSNFSGRIFSLEDYMDWYVERFGSFTYYEDWSGFNVPSTSFRLFRAGKFDPLSKKERRLLRLFHGEPEPFYVIGVAKQGSRENILHELAHALFYTNAAYRRAVQGAMRAYDTSSMERSLARMGYAKHVLQDEVHAYLATQRGSLEASQRRLTGLRKTLRALFKLHSSGISVE
jgi:hypothetical protein